MGSYIYSWPVTIYKTTFLFGIIWQCLSWDLAVPLPCFGQYCVSAVSRPVSIAVVVDNTASLHRLQRFVSAAPNNTASLHSSSGTCLQCRTTLHHCTAAAVRVCSAEQHMHCVTASGVRVSAVTRQHCLAAQAAAVRVCSAWQHCIAAHAAAVRICSAWQHCIAAQAAAIRVCCSAWQHCIAAQTAAVRDCSAGQHRITSLAAAAWNFSAGQQSHRSGRSYSGVSPLMSQSTQSLPACVWVAISSDMALVRVSDVSVARVMRVWCDAHHCYCIAAQYITWHQSNSGTGGQYCE